MLFWLKTIWKKTVNIGIHDDLSDWDVKRIRVLNGICTIAITLLFIYACLYTQPEARPVFWESVQGVFLYAVPIVLSHYRHYTAARVFFIIYNAFFYTFMAVAHGDGHASEYYLLPASICTLFFFKRFGTIAALFALNMACFFACKYSVTVIKPIFFMPANVNTSSFNYLLVFVSLLLIVLHFKTENNRQEELLLSKNKTLDEERLRSDNLLLNILPAETALELKTTGTAEPKYFEQATVLFASFENFGAFAREWPPETLVAEINECFSAFDAIVARHGLEKIKTIGGTYMCAGGLPQPNATHAANAVKAALEIQQFMQANRTAKSQQGRAGFHLRIGVHSGPVVAGIVGTKKFAYDIWGDTVNTAARMKSSSEADKVNISSTTHHLVKTGFPCTSRGKVEAKHKGLVEMFFVG